MKSALKSVAACLLVAGAAASQAAIVPIDAAHTFNPIAGVIDFTAPPPGGSLNPAYTAGQYGGGAGAPNVSFGSWFAGQSGGSNPTGTMVGAPLGTSLTCAAVGLGCIANNPAVSSPLSLDAGATAISIRGDSAHGDLASATLDPLTGLLVRPSDQTLGHPGLGSIAMLFSSAVAAVSFDGGFFNSIGAVRITAYGSNGAELGFLTNSTCGTPEALPQNAAPGTTPPTIAGCSAAFTTLNGIESVILGTSDGSAQIAGILLSLVLPEQAGFTIDNIRFGQFTAAPTCDPKKENCDAQVPEPASLALVGMALLGLGATRRRRKLR